VEKGGEPYKVEEKKLNHISFKKNLYGSKKIGKTVRKLFNSRPNLGFSNQANAYEAAQFQGSVGL
jgi:hypothetical protein